MAAVSFVRDVRPQGRVRAPELAGARDWLNTDKPLSIAGLRGKVVLLDFWTYGCVNCMHIIPDLKRLEAKYPNNLVVIGVHSAKFANEGETANIRNIILRYGLEHPVANDADFKIWNAYAVNAWPTQVVIDPAGYVIGEASGEGYYDALDALIGGTILEFRKKGLLDEKPLKFALERAKTGDLPLAFPGKILADAASKRLFIADSNHNRLVVTDLDGKLLETIGGGRAAWADGDFATAAFDRPQGLALDGTNLYVADTENQRLRLVDLKTKRVSTVAGTGNLRDFNGQGGAALETGLRSPWDLALAGRFLYIAMAGSHQIWRMDLDRKTLEPYAGTRAEARLDGKRNLAAFAQPSGIASDGKRLFVADSESNIVRALDFEKETVETLAGGDLFEFGDRDGEGDDVRFQHPLGVALWNGQVLVADTYNHKIRLLDPEKRTVKTFLGSGSPGQTDGARAAFYEPGGLSVAGGKLYVADTNNHAIRVVDLDRKTVSTLKIEGLTPPAAASAETESDAPNLRELKTDAKVIGAAAPAALTVDVKLPDGYHLNPNAPNRYEIAADAAGLLTIDAPARKLTALPLKVQLRPAGAGETALKVKLTLYYCREDDTGTCLIKTLVWRVPLKIDAGKKESAPLELTETLTEK
ncbi:MAG: redoxin domain-containing protein [Acidobacteria bacterium]|nr:redoxin domain-containing protein [Acidobacteriota bacterium]